MKALTMAMVLALAAPLTAQEVRVNVAFDTFEEANGAVALSDGIMYLYGPSVTLCQGVEEAGLRIADLQGRFRTGDILVLGCTSSAPYGGAVLPSGVVLIVLKISDADLGGIGGRLFDSWGNPLGPDFVINQVTARTQKNGAVAALKSGRFAVVWADDKRLSVYGRIVMPDGSMPGSEKELPQITSNRAFSPHVAATASGGALVVWESDDGSPPYQDRILARAFDADLNPVTGDQVVNVPAAGMNDEVPYIGADPSGNYFGLANPATSRRTANGRGRNGTCPVLRHRCPVSNCAAILPAVA